MAIERERHNAGAVFSLKYPLIWCPKYHKQVLSGAVEVRLKELLAEKAQELGATIHALEVMPDHVHLFLKRNPTKVPAHLAAPFKGYTARILREGFSYRKSSQPSLWSYS